MARKKLPVVLNNDERLDLLAQPNPRYLTGHRNRVLLQLMANLGLRLSEAINLRWRDIDFTPGILMVRNGKGGKDRTLHISNKNWRGESDREALEGWKARQAEALGKLPEFVFTTTSEGAAGQKLQPAYVQNMIKRYATRAALDKRVSPHTLRHTFATDLYRLTKNIVAVQEALGHSSIETTMVYVHLVGADLKAALAYPS